MGAPRTCCSTLLAILLPPVGVFVARGCDCQLLINILLTLCGYLPGIIHALFIICLTDDDDHKGLPVTAPHAAPVAPVTPAPMAVPNPPYPQGAQPVTVQGHPVAPPPGQYPAATGPGQYPAVSPATYAPPAGYPQPAAGDFGYPAQPKQV